MQKGPNIKNNKTAEKQEIHEYKCFSCLFWVNNRKTKRKKKARKVQSYIKKENVDI